MDQVIKKFFLFNFFGRILGILIDLVLVYFAAELYAKSYYLLSSVPVLIFSLSSYLSSISKISGWASNVMLKLKFTSIFVFCYCLTSYFVTSKTNFESYYSFVIILIVTSFFVGIIINTKAAKNENTIWLFPAAGFTSLCIGLIGALLFNGEGYEPFIVVFMMTILRPLLFLFNGTTIQETRVLSSIKLLSIVALGLCGLRHLTLVLYRFYVPDHYIIEYSFNSRIIQNVYAISLIPLMINASKFKLKKTNLLKILFFGIFSSITLSMFFAYYIDSLDYLKIHFNWLLVMLIMGIAIFSSDYLLVTVGNKYPLKVIVSQILVTIAILITNYAFWGLR